MGAPRVHLRPTHEPNKRGRIRSMSTRVNGDVCVMNDVHFLEAFRGRGCLGLGRGAGPWHTALLPDVPRALSASAGGLLGSVRPEDRHRCLRDRQANRSHTVRSPQAIPPPTFGAAPACGAAPPPPPPPNPPPLKRGNSQGQRWGTSPRAAEAVVNCPRRAAPPKGRAPRPSPQHPRICPRLSRRNGHRAI